MDPEPIQLMDPATQAILDALQSAYASGGWLAVVGLGLMLGVRAFRMFGGDELWSELRLRTQRGIVFGSAAVGAVAVAYSTGAPLTMALPGAVAAGTTAMALHFASERAGRRLRLTGNPKVDAALKLAFSTELKDPHPEILK